MHDESFIEVHKKFEKLKPKQWIPCNCEQCEEEKQKGIEPVLFDYNLLINYLVKGIEEIRCTKDKLNSVKVLSLLQNVFAVEQELNLEEMIKLLGQIESKMLKQDDLKTIVESFLTGREVDKDLAYKFSEIVKIKLPLGFADVDLSKLYQKYIHRKGGNKVI